MCTNLDSNDMKSYWWIAQGKGTYFIGTNSIWQINKEEGFMILDDSTGRVKVAGYNNIPFISLSLATGG